jgi:hypothetical protein
MRKDKLFLMSSILIVIFLLATAATCNLCGVPIEIGETTTEETESKSEISLQPIETIQSQSQSTESQTVGNNPPEIKEIEVAGGVDIELMEEQFSFINTEEDYENEIPFNIEAYDEDSDELNYSAYDSLGISFACTKIDNNNAEFIWSPPRAYFGNYVLTMEVSDGKGGKDSYIIDMNFTDYSEDEGAVDFGEEVNDPPEITRGIIIENLPGVDSPEGGPYIAGGIYYRVSVEAFDPNGDTLSYRWVGGGSNGYSDPTANPTEWITPELGTFLIRVYVNDGRGGEVVDSIIDVRVE